MLGKISRPRENSVALKSIRAKLIYSSLCRRPRCIFHSNAYLTTNSHHPSPHVGVYTTRGGRHEKQGREDQEEHPSRNLRKPRRIERYVGGEGRNFKVENHLLPFKSWFTAYVMVPGNQLSLKTVPPLRSIKLSSQRKKKKEKNPFPKSFSYHLLTIYFTLFSQKYSTIISINLQFPKFLLIKIARLQQIYDARISRNV